MYESLTNIRIRKFVLIRKFVDVMKSTELRQKPKSELRKLLQDSRERLRNLRFGLASGKVKNVREIRKIKKDIARILTLEAEERRLQRGKTRKIPRESA